jgi:hypothetical protein
MAFLMLGTIVRAQEEVDATFQFVDAQGQTVPDGSVITVNSPNSEGEMSVPLFVKNVSDDQAAVSMYEVLTDMPDGIWRTCAFGNCMELTSTGYSAKSVVNSDYNSTIQTEWIPEKGKYASWTATLQIQVFNITQKKQFGQVVYQPGNEIIGYGPKVTVKFDYRDPASISSAKTATAERFYSLTGRPAARPQKGVNIVRLADGKIVKRIIK